MTLDHYRETFQGLYGFQGHSFGHFLGDAFCLDKRGLKTVQDAQLEDEAVPKGNANAQHEDGEVVLDDKIKIGKSHHAGIDDRDGCAKKNRHPHTPQRVHDPRVKGEG